MKLLPQQLLDFAPDLDELRRAHAQRKIARHHWAVIVVQARSKPCDLANEAVRFESKRQQEQDRACAPADHDGRLRAFVHADVAEPSRQPVEGLEYSAVRALLERAPIVLDRIEIVVQGQFELRRSDARQALGRRIDMRGGTGPQRIFEMAFEH